MERSGKILSAFLGEELGSERVQKLVSNAFNFPAKVEQVEDGIYSLGFNFVLAFKDFGGRFMAMSL